MKGNELIALGEKPITENDFFHRVYEIVAQIPQGKVATYGQIAAMLGNPRGARTVGWAMQAAPEDLHLPCHRVINRTGALAPEPIFGGKTLQRAALEAEGVIFKADGRVDMERSQWRPDSVMNQRYMIEQAKPKDLFEVTRLYEDVIDYLETHTNYPHWKKHVYPNTTTAQNGINEGTLYLLRIGKRVGGSIILNHDQPKAYESLAWQVAAAENEIMVVHTLVVHPDEAGQGLGQALLTFAEKLSTEKGIKAIRLDVTMDNNPAIYLYEKYGYQFIGEVDLGFNIPGLELFRCYEKIL